MKPIVLKKGYSAGDKVGNWEIGTHVFEIIQVNGKQYRIDAGRVKGCPRLVVGTIAGPDIGVRCDKDYCKNEAAIISRLKKWIGGVK